MKIYIGAAMIFLPILFLLGIGVYLAATGDVMSRVTLGIFVWIGVAYWLLKDEV